MDPQLQALVQQHAEYLVVAEDGKVRCELNGHCLPAKLEVVTAFVNGAKYKKLVAKAKAEAALPKYEPFLVPSINFPDKLFCALTNQVITKSMEAVRQHMQGKRFQKAKDRFQQDKQELLEEPRLEDAMDEDEQEAEGEDGPGIWIPEGVESDSEEEGAAAAADDSSSEGAAAGGSDEEAGAAGPSSGGEDEAMAEAERPPQQAQRTQRAQRGKKAAAAGQAQQQEGTKAGEAGGRGRGKRGAAKQGAAPKEAALAAEEPNGTKAPSTKGKQKGRPSKAKRARTAK